MTTEEKNINHRKLLKKYMAHIDSFEGLTYTSYINKEMCSISFTDSEVKELRAIAKEVKQSN